MANRNRILDYLNEQLRIADFSDSSLNGLQIEGNEEVSHVAVAVDAGLSVIQDAVRNGADMLVVHHGLFWGKSLAVSGPHREKVQLALSAGLNLLAYHLPLDAHPEWGNNFSLGRELELSEMQPEFQYGGQPIGCVGLNTAEKSFDDIVDFFKAMPGAENAGAHHVVALNFGPQSPSRIGIVSGGGADGLEEALDLGVDTFITGEPRQMCFHFAKEHKLNAIFAGHYVTETIGVREIGKVLSEEFEIRSTFIDQPTGI